VKSPGRRHVIVDPGRDLIRVVSPEPPPR
jgi:hypothetical protein